jgi:hypothetical protein
MRQREKQTKSRKIEGKPILDKERNKQKSRREGRDVNGWSFFHHLVVKKNYKCRKKIVNVEDKFELLFN